MNYMKQYSTNMRKAVINFSDIAKDKELRMSPSFIFKQIDAGIIEDQSTKFSYKFKCFLRRFRFWRINN